MHHVHMSDRHSNASTLAALSDPIAAETLDDLGEGTYNRRASPTRSSPPSTTLMRSASSRSPRSCAPLWRSAPGRSLSAQAVRTGPPRLRRAGPGRPVVRYVNARNAFRSATDPESGANPATVDMALDRMKDAYRRWSAS